MKIKLRILILLWGISFFGMAQSPPDNPLAPQDWVDKMRTDYNSSKKAIINNKKIKAGLYFVKVKNNIKK